MSEEEKKNQTTSSQTDTGGNTNQTNTNTFDPSSLTDEQRSQIVRSHISEHGLPDDMEVSYKYRGETKKEPWSTIRDRVSGVTNVNALYEEHKKKVDIKDKELTEREQKLRDAEAFVRKQQQLLAGNTDTGQTRQDINVNDPKLRAIMDEFDISDPAEFRDTLAKADLVTKDAAKKMVEEALAEKFKELDTSKLNPVLQELAQMKQEKIDNQVRAKVFSEFPALNPDSEEYKNHPELYGAMSEKVFGKLRRLAAEADPAYPYEKVLYHKYGAGQAMQLVKDTVDAFTGDLVKYRDADREEQRKVNDANASHNSEVVAAAVSKAQEKEYGSTKEYLDDLYNELFS